MSSQGATRMLRLETYKTCAGTPAISRLEAEFEFALEAATESVGVTRDSLSQVISNVISCPPARPPPVFLHALPHSFLHPSPLRILSGAAHLPCLAL